MRIEFRNIVKTYGTVQANDDISLTLEEGTIQGLLGENGAGKTTLMKILSGYARADAGTTLLDGREVAFASPAEAIASGIGMLHQDPMDVPALSVLENFMLGCERGPALHRKRAAQRLSELSHQFGFALDRDELVGALTVGERQQLELVRLLALGVRVIVLDEPTTGISEPQKVLLFAALHKLAAQGLTVIFVSHKLAEVEALCSRATVLRAGRVVGEVQAPFSSDRLVMMMFGQCLERSARPVAELGDDVLTLRDAAVHTHQLSVEHITLSVRCGEVIGLAGLEGSGQRLLMQACAGIRRVAAGRLFVAGNDLTHQPYQRFLQERVAFVPAARLEEGMIPAMQIREHVALAQGNGRLFVDWEQADARADAVIRDFRVIGRPETPVQALSGGNQQRALLGLLPEALRLLILEHPTRGLDVESSRWVWSKLLARRAEGTAILFTSTDLDELVDHSDRIVVFSGGVMSSPVRAADVTCEELGYLIGGKQR
ncbi:MAG: ATP-binding cassette domain-containing protein [Chloroflexi bacterium]|nr:ATP-binding cassette domain-containing protein [Chloroflexota bacterium]